MAGRPLRVVIGFPFGARMGGAERLLWVLLRDRQRIGLEATVLAFRPGPFLDEIAALGVPVSVIEPGRFRHPWQLARAIVRVARLLRSTQPDLCVSWLPRVQTVLAPAAVLAGLGDRVVFFQHELAGRGGLSRVAVALPCRSVIANSTASLESTRRLWPHRDGSVVWPGIDRPEPPDHEGLERLRAELGLPAGRPVVGVAGRLARVKGIDRLIEAMGLLRDRGVDATLLVVGAEAHGVDTGHEAELRALVARLGLDDRVIFSGHVDDASGHMAVMDVAVQASTGDGFGLVVLEAWALGVPVVLAAGSGAVEIVEDGVSAVVVPTGAPAEIAGAIADLLADPARRAALAAEGSRRFDERFSSERMVDRIAAELAAAVPGARPPA